MSPEILVARHPYACPFQRLHLCHSQTTFVLAGGRNLDHPEKGIRTGPMTKRSSDHGASGKIEFDRRKTARGPQVTHFVLYMARAVLSWKSFSSPGPNADPQNPAFLECYGLDLKPSTFWEDGSCPQKLARRQTCGAFCHQA